MLLMLLFVIHCVNGTLITRYMLWNVYCMLAERHVVVPCYSDGHTFAASNFHTEASRVRTGRMVIQTVGFELQYLPFG